LKKLRKNIWCEEMLIWLRYAGLEKKQIYAI